MIPRWKLAAASGGIGLLLLLVLAASRESAPAQAGAERPKASFEVGLPTAQEVRAMVGAYGQRVEQAERGLSGLQDELRRTRTAFEQALQSLAAERPGAVEAPREPDPTRFRLFELGGGRPRQVHIPAGSFVEATLLTGVYAPTNGDPLPVLLRLDAALIGPNRTRLALPRALLVGKAVGDANSRRATIQIDTLSAADGDGRIHELKANGWVVDDDGIQGLRGTYVWRADEIAGLAAASSGLAAGADALAARETTSQTTPLGGATSVVTGDPLRLAEFRALGGAASKLAEIVAERLREVVPAIHVANGRKVTVAFIGGVSIDGLEPREVQDGASGAPWRGLDADR